MNNLKVLPILGRRVLYTLKCYSAIVSINKHSCKTTVITIIIYKHYIFYIHRFICTYVFYTYVKWFINIINIPLEHHIQHVQTLMTFLFQTQAPPSPLWFRSMARRSENYIWFVSCLIHPVSPLNNSSRFTHIHFLCPIPTATSWECDGGGAI